MNKQEIEEIEILNEILDPKEMFVLGYLKGFNRNSMKEWARKGLYQKLEY
ncbi:MAG: hypothetical protein WC867_06925 [Candidatus Pacearchaeota archaeon]|jgi:hypothetical protein